ncbi:MAG: hypothetical protein FWG93_04950 [Oscillospiraceae bacterium]|nr:hypothetical protein [Oscillospiraceae bacterium]
MKKNLLTALTLCLIGALAAGCGGKKPAAGIDVDLTALSGVMVYAEVYNMMTSPEEYLGKTIKANGSYAVTYYDKTGQYYHFVLVEDAGACCQQGLEFRWSGERVYPDEYPAENAKIELVGVYSRYELLGDTLYYLAVDELTVPG